MGKVNGAPLVLSEYMREDLNATGAFDGVNTNITCLLIVYRGGAAIRLLYGRRASLHSPIYTAIPTQQELAELEFQQDQFLLRWRR